MPESPEICNRTWKRSLFLWCRRLFVLYLTVVLLMWWFENKLVYYPVKAADGWQDPPVAEMEEVDFPTADGTRIHAWWLPHPNATRTLLVFHGNAGNLSDRGPTVARISELFGMNVMIFDYPGFGKSEGSPNEERCYASAEAAIRWLKQAKQIAPEQTVFYAESIGGGVAIEMATRYPCRNLVLVKTFTRLPLVAKKRYPWLPVDWLMSNRYDNLSKIGRVTCPVLIASATADRLIPYEMGEQLFAAANEPKQFYRDEGHDHNDRMPDDFWPTLKAFLDS
jgi:uncharacterized protein